MERKEKKKKEIQDEGTWRREESTAIYITPSQALLPDERQTDAITSHFLLHCVCLFAFPAPRYSASHSSASAMVRSLPRSEGKSREIRNEQRSARTSRCGWTTVAPPCSVLVSPAAHPRHLEPVEGREAREKQSKHLDIMVGGHKEKQYSPVTVPILGRFSVK